MYVILVYDINTETKEGKSRIVKLMKKCRQFLHHTQKSVFEGEITEAKLLQLTSYVKRLIDEDDDYVVVYNLLNKNNLKRDIYGKKFDVTTNIL